MAEERDGPPKNEGQGKEDAASRDLGATYPFPSEEDRQRWWEEAFFFKRLRDPLDPGIG